MALAPIDIRKRQEDTECPLGWFWVCYESELLQDELLPISLLGMELVAYRLPDGRAQVASAWCPHMGAHLASSDGCLREGRVICPFHRWQFDGASGRLAHIPYSNVLPNASLLLHETQTVDGKVMIWHDPEGSAPSHVPFDAGEFGSAEEWQIERECTYVSTAPFLDARENLFDTAHFEQLHGTTSTPGIKALTETDYGLRIDYDVSPDLGDAPLLRMEFHFTGVTDVTKYFEGENWKLLVLVSHTPIDEQKFVKKVRFQIHNSTSSDVRPTILGTMVPHFVTEIEQDLRILDFKKRLSKPLLCAGDGPIQKFRTYAERFKPKWVRGIY